VCVCVCVTMSAGPRNTPTVKNDGQRETERKKELMDEQIE